MSAQLSERAVHEVGHVVVGRYFAHRMGTVRLTPDSPTQVGYVVHAETVRSVDPATWVATLLGGRAAVAELCPWVSPAQRDAMAARDLEHARAWLEACCEPEQVERELRRADGRARAVVILYRGLTAALAAELDRRGHLHITEQDVIIRQYQEAAA